MLEKRPWLSCILGTGLLLFSTIVTSCSSRNSLLTENLELTLPEQKELDISLSKHSPVFYTSNLSNFTFPTRSELMTEIGSTNEKSYFASLEILLDWMNKSLSTKERAHLIQNCQILIGNRTDRFPLNDKTLACAAWWVEKLDTINKQAHLSSQTSINSFKATNITSKKRKDWKNYRSINFVDAMDLLELKSFREAQSFLTQALTVGLDCSYRDINAALFFKLDAFLPEKSIYLSEQRLYERLQTCLNSSQEIYEKVHLRMGLLSLLYGDEKYATVALEKALKTKSPLESTRTLFWLGAIQQKNLSFSLSKNNYWRTLIDENPISIHAIWANQQMGTAPENFFVSDNSIAVQHRTDSGWNLTNVEGYIFESLLAVRQQESARAWASYVMRLSLNTDVRLDLYWAIAQNHVGNIAQSIFSLNKYFRQKKSIKISDGLLKLQFPIVYLNEISSENSGVDPILILALMRQESAFNPYAHSQANARGLMQVLPTTARSIRRGVRPNDLFDPNINIMIGSAYVERLLKRYNGRIEYLLAAYNAGALNLDKWIERVPEFNSALFCDYIPYKETRSYISIILRNYYWYGKILGADKNNALAQKISLQSRLARWKSENVSALLHYSAEGDLNTREKKLLNSIYIFGNTPNMHANDSKLPIDFSKNLRSYAK